MLHQIEKWSASHHPRWLVLPRIALGMSLILKGISFMSDTVMLENMLTETNVIFRGDWLPLVITSLHLFCGLLIIIGLFTRWATLLMIPILLGAVLLINIPGGTFSSTSEFIYSLIVFLLLLFFFIEGGGPISLDEHYGRNRK